MKKKLLIAILCVGVATEISAQLAVSGVVYDSSRRYGVEHVKVINAQGDYSYSDSVGRYRIPVTDNDTIYFFFRNKPTQKFAVNNIRNLESFDVLLHINYRGKYRLMDEVTVISKSFKEKELENRETYARIFNYEKPGLTPSVSNGVAGADLNALINLFRFRHNKTMRWFREKLLTEEQERYIDYRFSKKNVKRITGLDGGPLDSFMIIYRPPYEFTIQADELVFNQYVLNCYYEFKIEMLKPQDP